MDRAVLVYGRDGLVVDRERHVTPVSFGREHGNELVPGAGRYLHGSALGETDLGNGIVDVNCAARDFVIESPKRYYGAAGSNSVDAEGQCAGSVRNGRCGDSLVAAFYRDAAKALFVAECGNDWVACDAVERAHKPRYPGGRIVYLHLALVHGAVIQRDLDPGVPFGYARKGEPALLKDLVVGSCYAGIGFDNVAAPVF